MSAWAWVGVGLACWILVAVIGSLVVGRALRLTSPEPALARRGDPRLDEVPSEQASPTLPWDPAPARRRVVIVDDDPGVRALLRATLASDELELADAASAEEAREVVRFWRPDVVLLDVAMPGLDGISFCRELKASTTPPFVALVTGAEIANEQAVEAGADAVLTKPFSPLELVEAIDRLARPRPAFADAVPAEDQLLLYARDLSRLLESERAQRRRLETAYRQTVTALAATLETKDTGTRLHSLRVTRYALELAERHDARLLADPSLVYGFLLHDIGKIGVPDRILLKDGPLEPGDWEIVRQHPLIGQEILGEVAVLAGAGLDVVRSHHERWDGAGYPDGLARDRIPFAARVFAVADALDAITSDRPYREARTWEAALSEIERQAGRQFDPAIVETLTGTEHALRGIYEEMRLAA